MGYATVYIGSVCVDIRICMYMCVYIHMYTYIYMYICRHTYMHIGALHLASNSICTYVCTHTCMYGYTYVCIDVVTCIWVPRISRKTVCDVCVHM